ncbi:MAG: recombinase family protein, partial [Gaiellales bacterium]
MYKAPSSSLAAYVRVSTAAQAASGLGLDAQRQAIAEAAVAGGFTIGSWHEDAGCSGATTHKRQGLGAALAAIEAGTAGGLVVAKIDRLGRSYDVMMLIGRAAREGWRLVALDVGLDTTTPEGELVAGALTMAARFEWRRISQRQ